MDGSRARITVPAGTQTGQQFRLRAKGMSVLRSHERGDMYAQIMVETPMNLTKRQQELLRNSRMPAKASSTAPRPKASSPRSRNSGTS